MPITLQPPVANLGIMAPVLGPWFSTNVQLPAPNPAQNLSLSIDFGNSPPGTTDVYAPATGTLSLYVTTAGAPPAALDALQNSTGAWAFPTSGRLVAFFRLLPEVEARLHELVGLVPAASPNIPANPPGLPSRPQVRSLAIVFPQIALTPATVFQYFGTIQGATTDAERATALGLALDNGNLVNGAVPMTWLRRPGGAQANRDKLLQGLDLKVDLWAFDRRGRPIDPGAVAAWWSWLLNTGVGDNPATPGTVDYQLLAPGMGAADYPQDNALPVVVRVDPQLTVHLVDAHEGPLGDPFINGRLLNGANTVTQALILQNGLVDLKFSPAPTTPAPPNQPPADNPPVDNAPRPRLAVLPNGQYASAAQVWPNAPANNGLPRDFVRVAVVEEESFLVGVTRQNSRATIVNADDRRRSAQNRPSTRINVNRTLNNTGVLLANSQSAADALLGLPVANPRRFVLGLGDLAWGGTPAAVNPPLPLGPANLPNTLADSGANNQPNAGQYRVRAVTGGGQAGEHQTVLLEVNLGTGAQGANAGAWVRAWPLGFDLTTGSHFRLTGGAGRADASGVAQLTMVLPPGKVDAAALMGMDLLVLVTNASGQVVARRHYADRRFDRPTPVGGQAANANTGASLACETGAAGNPAVTPAGGHLVQLGGPTPALVDRTTIPPPPATAWDGNTLIRKLQQNDIISLTAPAFGSTPDRADVTGRPLPRSDPSGASHMGGLDTIVGNRLHLLDRSLLTDATASSVPYALLDRLEVAGATVSTAPAAANAAIGAAPAVPWALEPPSSQFLGHPGVAASIEIHGTGVSLDGAPAVAVAEYVRERTAGLGIQGVQMPNSEPVRSAVIQSEIALAAEGATAFPSIADPATAGPVVAVLRTAAYGMEGLPGIAVAATNTDVFPTSRPEADLESWLNAQGAGLPGAPLLGNQLRAAAGGPIDSLTRALDRRIYSAAFGAREALTALLAAFDRAEDLVYIETPAVDDLPIDTAQPNSENLKLWDRLVSRMNARPGLRVVLCVPTLLAPGTPLALQEVRDECLMAALDHLRGTVATGVDRLAVFSPGAGADRSVRFASTSVIVDDAFALTGTTHLWRRGLSWDSSLAASVFDERISDGRPVDVQLFRIQLLADRLGIPAAQVPADPAELVKAIRDLDSRASERLSTRSIERPVATQLTGDLDAEIWNPDGSDTGLTLAGIAKIFLGAVALTDVEHAIMEG